MARQFRKQEDLHRWSKKPFSICVNIGKTRVTEPPMMLQQQGVAKIVKIECTFSLEHTANEFNL